MKDTIEIIKSAYINGLHGEEAQYRMAPKGRQGLAKYDFEKLQPRLAAVLMLIYPSKGEPHMVFTKRHEYPGVHSGQISFPGGEIEEVDTTLADTALRETEEELSVQRDQVDIVGSLTKLYINPSNFLVTPYLAYSSSTPKFKPDEFEVASILELPLQEIILTEPIETKVRLSTNSYRRVPAYNHRGHIIWGATAMMLSELISMMKKSY